MTTQIFVVQGCCRSRLAVGALAFFFVVLLALSKPVVAQFADTAPVKASPKAIRILGVSTLRCFTSARNPLKALNEIVDVGQVGVWDGDLQLKMLEALGLSLEPGKPGMYLIGYVFFADVFHKVPNLKLFCTNDPARANVIAEKGGGMRIQFIEE